jgi:hypothetical protein
VKLSGAFQAILTLLLLVVGTLVWGIARDATLDPYRVERGSLSSWTIVRGQPDEPCILAALPPPALASSLLRQVKEKTGLPLVSPDRVSLPLVMRDEYAEGLQGVYSIEAMTRIARDAGIEMTTFEPVCVGHRIETSDTSSRALFFVLFDSPGFDSMRQALVPAFPEHAGTGMYYAETLRPILAIAASDDDFARWWPMRVDRPTDCEAQVTVR